MIFIFKCKQKTFFFGLYVAHCLETWSPYLFYIILKNTARVIGRTPLVWINDKNTSQSTVLSKNYYKLILFLAVKTNCLLKLPNTQCHNINHKKIGR